MSPLHKRCMQPGASRLHFAGIIRTAIFLFMSAQCTVGQPLLSLDDVIKTGLENNFGIRIVRNEAIISANNNTPGNAGFLPEIGISGGYETSIRKADVEVISGMEINENAANTEWLDAGVFLNWKLFDGMNMFINHDRLKTLQEMGELNTRLEMEKTLSGIIILYHEIIRHQMMEKVLSDQVELSHERTRIAETRNSIGAASELEYLRAQVDLNADELALIQQQTFTNNARIALNEILGRDVSIMFQVEDTILLKDHLDLETLNETCLASNAELQRERYGTELDRLDLKSLEGVRYPVLSLYSGYDFMRNETEASFIEYNRQLGPYLGLSLQFTLFDGMNRKREVQNARITIENAALSEQELLLAVLARLNQHYNQYESELRVIDLEKHNLVLAEKNMDIAGESYRIGTLSSIELREVQENLLEANSRLIVALFRVKVQETELLRLSGNLLSD